MAKRNNSKEPRGNYRFLVIVAAALLLSFLVSTFFYSIARVYGASMSPCLEDGNWIIVDRRAYCEKGPAYGDIIVIKKPDVTGQPIIKRVMGLPRDTLAIRSGRLYRNGSPVIHDFAAMDKSENMGEITVPSGCYFLMGDNRRVSNDSRKWKKPFVQKDEIMGKAVLRFLPSFSDLR